MRIKIHLSTKGGQILPFNYQYPLASWLYKTLSRADRDYADFLHQNGYGEGNKQFKLFTFSKFLTLPKYKRLGDRMKLEQGKLSFIVGLKVNQAVESLVKGLFDQQEFRIGDEISQIDLRVEGLEVETLPTIQHTMRLRTLSPVVISHGEEGRKHAQYIGPEKEQYEALFFQNLLHKYQAWSNSFQESMPSFQADQMQFRLLNMHKKASQLVTLKAFTNEETQVKGFQYDVELTAPKELIEFGLEVGFGEKNAMGFGCCGVVK